MGGKGHSWQTGHSNGSGSFSVCNMLPLKYQLCQLILAKWSQEDSIAPDDCAAEAPACTNEHDVPSLQVEQRQLSVWAIDIVVRCHAQPIGPETAMTVSNVLSLTAHDIIEYALHILFTHFPNLCRLSLSDRAKRTVCSSCSCSISSSQIFRFVHVNLLKCN